MQEKVREIAARVKELRELSGVSTAEMAACIQASEEYYISYEAGNEDISASCLFEISQKLHVDLALLLTGHAPRMASFSVTRKGKGVIVDRRRQYHYQALAANFTGKKAEPFLVTVPPSPPDAPIATNAHPGQEMDYMISGQLKLVICGNEIVLNEGDTVYYDSSNPHGMAAIGDEPAKFIAIIM